MKRGYTLIEMLFYIVLLAALLLVVINSLVLITSSYHNIKSSQVIESSGTIAMDRMMLEIRNAQSVSLANTASLIINTGTTTPAQITLDGSTSTLAIYEDGVYSGPLLSRDARVKSLVFRLISTSTSAAVRVELEIESGTSTFYKSEKFYDTAILRGSY